MSTIDGKYKVNNRIGSGSFADVYNVTNIQSQEVVAIKVIKMSKLGDNPKSYENLRSEIDIMSKFQHRGICRLYESFKKKENIYLVIEYCAGGDLQQFIKKGVTRRLPETVCRKFLVQLAEGLQFLHNQRIIHRDIKPQNILLSESSEDAILKIADFGFSKHLEEFRLTQTMCGTPLYMAPEIVGDKPYDVKVDIWSMGCVLFEMIVGHPPFQACDWKTLKTKCLDSTAIRIPDDVSVTSDMVVVVGKLLEKNPQRRASVDEFVRDSETLFNTIVEGNPQLPQSTQPIYSPAPMYALPTETIETDNRPRVHSADSIRRSENNGWSHSQSHSSQLHTPSPSKCEASSSNTISILDTAARFFFGPTSLGSSHKTTDSATTGCETPQRIGQKNSSGSPHWPTSSKTVSNSSPLISRPFSSESSDDFVMIDRQPQRPWRAVESESVSGKEDPSTPSSYSPVYEDSPQCGRETSTDAASGEPQIRQSLSSLVSEIQYTCLVVYAITQVADDLITKAYESVVDNEEYHGERKLEQVRMCDYIETYSGKIDEDGLMNAMSLYLRTLKIMQDTMQRIAEVRNLRSTRIDILNKMSETLSLRYQELIKRSESCYKILTDKCSVNLQDLKTYPTPEPILYQAALSLAREASVGEVLGNLEQACDQYEMARTLIECIVMTTEHSSDKRILLLFRESFARQHEQCKKLCDAF